MIPALPLFHRVAGRPVLVLGTGAVAEARRRLVERAGGEALDELEAGLARGARLAFLTAEDAPALARLRGAGVLVNVADRPELCDFTVPALVDRAPVLIAIGTGGASAGLAKALRLRLETPLPASLGALADALHAARDRLRARWPDPGERRRALDAALGEGGALDPLRKQGDGAVEAWLAARENAGVSGVIEIVLRSADPDDLTLGEARLLGSADAIVHEAGIPPAILDRARADARRVVAGMGADPAGAEGLVVVIKSGL